MRRRASRRPTAACGRWSVRMPLRDRASTRRASRRWRSNVFVVLFVLLICANVAALVFARDASRESEILVRSALGASRGRILMQLFVEALVLGGVAAVAGLGAGRLAPGMAARCPGG